MKRRRVIFMLFFFIFFILCMAVTISCDTKYEYGDTSYRPGNVVHFEHNKHQYIRFGACPGVCIVHDPDCKYCFEKFD